ncbi:BlaI/MecI/CopY family transcriptional regulator, partial [Singulisphaera rosea]
MANQPGLSEAEREVLRALWENGPGTVREINGFLERQGRHWAYTTVATLLQRLQSKGYVAGDTTTVPHVF